MGGLIVAKLLAYTPARTKTVGTSCAFAYAEMAACGG